MKNNNDIACYNLYIYKDSDFINRVDISDNIVRMSSDLSSEVVINGIKGVVTVSFFDKFLEVDSVGQDKKQKVKYNSYFNIDDFSFKCIKILNKKSNLTLNKSSKHSVRVSKWLSSNYLFMLLTIGAVFLPFLLGIGEKDQVAYASIVLPNKPDQFVLNTSLEIIASEYSNRLSVELGEDRVELQGFIESESKLNELILELKNNIKIGLVNSKRVFTLKDLNSTLERQLKDFNIIERSYIEYRDDKFYLAGNFIGRQTGIVDEIIKLIEIKYNISEIKKTYIDNRSVLLQDLVVAGMWIGEKPYIKLSNGVKYHIGAKLPSGWVLNKINESILLFSNNSGQRLSLKVGAS
ncbi:SctD/MshK family protein [Spartinivicinus poritis]|uniref:YscD/Y4YQ C-terminal domain-containing protein n=1 Tax=Spartinivicinus poritis TaxID=2994640 RepID=A0ABT5U4P3_9GAMM|nr:hypothetical protein [Spartinivicinus sp. A2-2]MDE1460951.1 hypothetical protein [Spartinivicinus sp. A2-2]